MGILIFAKYIISADITKKKYQSFNKYLFETNIFNTDRSLRMVQ